MTRQRYLSILLCIYYATKDLDTIEDPNIVNHSRGTDREKVIRWTSQYTKYLRPKVSKEEIAEVLDTPISSLLQ